MNSKKDLNEKYLSFLDQTKDDTHKAVNHLNDRVLIVDGLNTFIRSFAVNPALNEDGLHIGGMVGFMKSVRYSCDILKPSRCIIVFDGKGGSKRRQKIYPEYKGTRKVKRRLNRNVDWGTAPQDEQQSMKQQMGRLIEYLEQLPLTLICVDGIEADDTMAYISQQILKKSDIFLMSTDKDFLQLVDDRVKIWSPTKKKLYDKKKVFEERIKMNNEELMINWGFAEMAAYATLLKDGFPVRVTGQDSRRGTFSHRHLVVKDQNTGEGFVPLSKLNKGNKKFEIFDSLLSEEAVLGFEYGYASTWPEGLVIWEAQFGDFVNVAQVIIDQFIAVSYTHLTLPTSDLV